MELEFTADAVTFLALAHEYLEEHALVATVLATQALRRTKDPAGAHPDDWYAVARDGRGAVVGAAMRTTPTAPRTAYLGPMPDESARQLARTLHERGEPLQGANGARRAARVCAEQAARLGGGTVAVSRRTRLFELGDAVAPRPVPGRLRVLTDVDLELATSWYAAFHADADEQAGRVPAPVDPPAPHEMRRRIRSGRTFLWVDANGTPVHLTGSNPPGFGVARIGPVYTPPGQRGRGWASAAVHAVASALVGEDARVCLFTDLANPTSNAIYRRLGFAPVTDTVDLVIDRAAG